MRIQTDEPQEEVRSEQGRETAAEGAKRQRREEEDAAERESRNTGAAAATILHQRPVETMMMNWMRAE